VMGRHPTSAEVYVGDKHIGTATDVEVDFGLDRREPSVAAGMVEPLGAWKVYGPKPLPPWTPEHRERVRQELRANPLFFAKVPTVTRTPDQATLFDAINNMLRAQSLTLTVPSSAEMTILSPRPQPTVLREERRARAANVRHYCRKCRGLGTKRHHAMCPKRGVWRQTYKWVAPGYESGQDRRKQANQR
jgi:hypothetical protein